MAEENEKWNQVIIEIRDLRNDVREDVNNLHKKIDDTFNILDKKIESNRNCIVEKIQDTRDKTKGDVDSLRKERTECFEGCTNALDKKISGGMFKWVVGILAIAVLSIGGMAGVNQADIKEANTKIEQHMKSSSEMLEKIDDNFNQYYKKSNKNHELIEDLKNKVEKNTETLEGMKK